MKNKMQSNKDKIDELEKKILELEKLAESLDEKLSDIEGAWSVLIVKFGNEIRKRIDDRVDANIDEIEYKKAIILFYEQNNASYFKELFIEQFKQAISKYF